MKRDIFRKICIKIFNKRNDYNKLVQEDENLDKEDDDDYLVKTIGAFGIWHAVVSVTVSLTRVVAIWNMMSSSFLTPSVDFFCVDLSDNVNVTHVKKSTCYNNCSRYVYSSDVKRSIIEDYGLICDKAWLANFTQSILMMGLWIGAAIFGWVSDRYGRRIALLHSTLLNAVFMIALPFSPSYVIFATIRFVIGIATGGSFIIGIVYVLEITGKQYREIAGTLFLIPDGLAEASLAGFAYFTSNWQDYTLSYGVATCFIFILVLFVPESPRWLVSKRKTEEAIEVTIRAAHRNKLDIKNIKEEITKAVMEIQPNGETVKASYMDFFESKTIFIVTAAIFVMWLALGMCFFGIFQFVTIIGIDPYLSVVTMGLIQIPFCPLGIIINKTLGRKISIIVLASIIAVTMFILIFVPKGHLLGTGLGIVAFISCDTVFDVVYIYMTELFPTPVRSMAFALSASGARVSAMIAPFIATLSSTSFPSLVFCVSAIIMSLSCLVLPETKGRNLQDSIMK